MAYLNETQDAVMITDMETLYSFAENLRYKGHLNRIAMKFGLKEVATPDEEKPKWVWRREKTPMAYKSLEWGNVLQTIKTNFWGRKIALFYNRMKVRNGYINFVWS